MSSFYEFLASRFEAGGFSTEDCLASLLPLVREVLDAHTAGMVAPLDGLGDLSVEGTRIWFEEARRTPIRNARAELRRIEQTNRAAVEIVSETRRTSDVDAGEKHVELLEIGGTDEPITRPVYLAGYTCWEHALGHHDPLTDIFSLGMLLASMACGLDFHEAADLRRFVRGRSNLFSLSADLHPVIAQAILRMTELDRRRRVPDLAAVAQNLQNYRNQDVSFEVDLARISGFATRDLSSRQQVVLGKLEERLFEISRRNRLLQFRPTMQTVNLTHASVPLSFDIKNIRQDQILVWNEKLRKSIVAGKPIPLNKHLNFAEALYLPSTLNKILTESRRDQAEFGFVQLRLVLCFLHWANLKEKPIEHYDSPLVLLPVRLVKKRGIRDTFFLEPQTAEAEVNPVIRHQFKVLFDIELPETVDLEATDLDTLYDYLAARIAESEAAVTLNKIDRPRIELVHERARRKLDQYRRRARIAGRGVRTFLDLDYSYDPANYHPLGLKLFSARIRASSTRLRETVEAAPRPRSYAVPPNPESEPPYAAGQSPRQSREEETPPEPSESNKTTTPAGPVPVSEDPAPQAQAPTALDPVVEKQRSLFSLKESTAENPYVWNFDQCSLTLANFKYRKMSLVRDYEALVEAPPENPAFDDTFSLVPRPAGEEAPPSPSLEHRFDVVACDPTQATAIARARLGDSYIIQGPPGTGKSQTITNLIADYVARGLRVLFVCEKRAALDVVFARLRQCGLGKLCTLIHDSQADKKAFVMDLKGTYEGYLEAGGEPHDGRNRLLAKLGRELEPLEQFNTAMSEVPQQAGLPLRKLVGRCVELAAQRPNLSPLEKERLPEYRVWINNRDRIERYQGALCEIEPDGVLARHPLNRLTPRLVQVENPFELVTESVADAREHLRQLVDHLGESGLDERWCETLAAGEELIAAARRLAPLAYADQMRLTDATSQASRDFQRAARSVQRKRDELEAAREQASGWTTKIPKQEVAAAMSLAESLQGKAFVWLRPSWWRLRGLLRRSYNFRKHFVRLEWTEVIGWLAAEYEAVDALSAASIALAEEFGFDYAAEGDAAAFVQLVGDVQSEAVALDERLAAFRQALVESPEPAALVDGALDLEPRCQRLSRDLERIFDDYHERSMSVLADDLANVSAALDELPDYLYCVEQLDGAAATLTAALRHLPLPVASVEAAVADRALADSYRANRNVARFNAATRGRHAERIETLYDQWQEANAQHLEQQVRDRFLEHVRIAGLPAAQLDDAQKDFKRSYNRGRRELEHEFGKTMRYKSIRDLVAGESGEVVKDIKPVWLMSPLSVSDTLPLETDHFDVVIFDEASQITLEESVPSIFRAQQAIVVGDQMQLPPTDFFSASRHEEQEEEDELADETVAAFAYDLNSNSFLNHAARNLSSTMLGWHYRSRSESLISFSNWAFYDGRLLTVPSENLPQSGAQPLVAQQADDADAHAAAAVERPVSFHYLEHGVYERRRNRGEADYIARLVRQLLLHPGKLSVGVVAFSEAQQDEIDLALARLGEADAEFRGQLEAELEREDDGQFVGLLVKNLENIQGDERDVIVLSVCYGHNSEGKMRMNFGPINKSGGEKRLNVAFSRAKQHMVVVSSIRSSDISNDYNDGANCLKNYLRYVEAESIGEVETSARILQSQLRWDEGDEDAASPPPLVEQLAAALAAEGYHVDLGVGQSHFRCDLAVRKRDDSAYRLGILVDDDHYYGESDLLDRDVMRPRLLRAFGWQICHVLTKDWYTDQTEVMNELLQALEQASPPQRRS